MLLSFAQLVIRYKPYIKGVIHVGAHHGEEVDDYLKYGLRDIVLIEPCSKAFAVLHNKYGSHHHIKLINMACGTLDCEAEMYVETANKGQSNSLLKPVNHLTHYPDIKFNEKERVRVNTLDSLLLPDKFNFLNMDVQGAEGHVLNGAADTLRHVDYVYTEINRDDAQLYEGAVGITELDAILGAFKRVETKWTDQGWGDAFYIRKTLL